jgi:anaphase-promoting complex subunit 2
MVQTLVPKPRVSIIFRRQSFAGLLYAFYSLGPRITSAYATGFQTHLISILPPIFSQGFKALCATSLPPPDDSNTYLDPSIWLAFETLGLVDRYESLIASVAFEYIESHVVSTCSGKWAEPMLNGLKDWMANKVVAWMVLPYARQASNCDYLFCLSSVTGVIVPAQTAEEARILMQGVGSRFDFHMNKTLCDLRSVGLQTSLTMRSHGY